MSCALVIGGTGTLGKSLVPKLLERHDRVRVLSRNEHTQTVCDDLWGSDRVDFFVGNVRDEYRMELATKGAHEVYLLAAVKSVDKAEYNPTEAVAINIDGAKNVIKACITNKVKKCMFTSTDKAVEPINLYGASKLAAEKLWIQANALVGGQDTTFNVCRYGNVLGSQGSVLERWGRAVRMGKTIDVTDPDMTRFWILKDDAAIFVDEAAQKDDCGAVYIPFMKACTMEQLSKAFLQVAELDGKNIRNIGVRPGEKMHEKLISEQEKHLVTMVDGSWIRWPSNEAFSYQRHGKPCRTELTSENSIRLTMEELRGMVFDALDR